MYEVHNPLKRLFGHEKIGNPAGQIFASQKTAAAVLARCFTTHHLRFSNLPPSLDKIVSVVLCK